MPTPACNAQDNTSFIYDHGGERKVKTQSSPVIYPNAYYVDFGGGSGNQFKNIFIGSERILTKKARVAPDRQHWYWHTDHLHSTGMVTNENSQMVDAVHYFPFGEVWLEEVPASLPVDYFFTAKELDQETGFYYFGARYLDPRFSKWMTVDPALGSYLPSAGIAKTSLPGQGGVLQPKNLGLYGYAFHNPLIYADPTGRESTEDSLKFKGTVVGTPDDWLKPFRGTILDKGEGDDRELALNALMFLQDQYLQRCIGMCHTGVDPGFKRPMTPREQLGLELGTAGITLFIPGPGEFNAVRAGGEGLELALGLNATHAGKTSSTLLERFTAIIRRTNPGVKNYGEIFGSWGGASEDVIKARILDLMKRADKIHFNRDQMSQGQYMKWLQNPAAKGGYTNWELKQILSDPTLREKTMFYGEFLK